MTQTQTTATERVKVQAIGVSDIDELIKWYPWNSKPQACFIALDVYGVSKGDMFVDIDIVHEVGVRSRTDIRYGKTIRYYIPFLRPATVNQLLEEIEPLAQRVVDGAHSYQAGEDWITVLNEDASTADKMISDIVRGYTAEVEPVHAEDVILDGGNGIREQLRAGRRWYDIVADIYANALNCDGKAIVDINEYVTRIDMNMRMMK